MSFSEAARIDVKYVAAHFDARPELLHRGQLEIGLLDGQLALVERSAAKLDEHLRHEVPETKIYLVAAQ